MADSLEQYRQPWESDKAWKMRKAFLARHWNAVAKNRLLCLSQVFANVEELGNSYHQDVMEEVRAMAEGLFDAVDEHVAPPTSDATLAPVLTLERAEEVPRKIPRVLDEPEPTCANGRGEEEKTTILAEESLLCRLRAQVNIIAHDVNPLNRMNTLTNAEKCQWLAHMTENECALTINGVLVVTTVHWGDELQAKMDACETAWEVIQRKSHKLVPLSNDCKVDAHYELQTANQCTDDHQAPSSWRLAGLQRRLRRLTETFEKMNSSYLKSQPQSTLKNVSNQMGMPLLLDRQRLVGWSERHYVKLANVVVYETETRAAVQQQQQQQQQSASTSLFEDQLCTKAIDSIMKLNKEFELKEFENCVVKIVPKDV